MKAFEDDKVARKKLRVVQAHKRELSRVGLHEPDHADIEYERSLRRVATRGVVALFNAITQNQHAAAEGGEKVSARDVKQLSKDNFLQMLATGANVGANRVGGAAPAAGPSIAAKPVQGGASAWLRDDFMTMGRGKSIKDWERHDEEGGSDGDDDESSEGGGDNVLEEGDTKKAPSLAPAKQTKPTKKTQKSKPSGKKTSKRR
jgi:hypothetical protein